MKAAHTFFTNYQKTCTCQFKLMLAEYGLKAIPIKAHYKNLDI